MHSSDWSSDVCSSDLNRQSGGGRLQILELSAPVEIVASRQLHLRDLRLRFLDERACIAPFQVQLDNNAALAVLASYLVKSFGEPYLGHLYERDMSAHCARFFGQEDRQREDVDKVDAGCIRHADGAYEARIAFVEQS